jgi:hypothetical protein
MRRCYMVRKNTGEALSREAAVMRSLAKDIGGLQELCLPQLRSWYREVFGEEARSKNLHYLRKKIAFRVQERMERGLSVAAKNRIQELVAVELPFGPTRPARRPALKVFPGASAPPERDPRLPQSGSMVVREFKGFAHEVQVLESTFLYWGRSYRSLSAVAKEITGTPWNEFLFFGLTGRVGRDDDRP